MFQVREGTRVKSPTKLATWPDKIHGKLEKVWGDSHLLTPPISLLAPCLLKLLGTVYYRERIQHVYPSFREGAKAVTVYPCIQVFRGIPSKGGVICSYTMHAEACVNYFENLHAIVTSVSLFRHLKKTQSKLVSVLFGVDKHRNCIAWWLLWSFMQLANKLH